MRIAAFTMSYNEPQFLPLWHSYYSAQIGADNVFVIDHGSDDGSSFFLRNNIVKIPHGEYDTDARSKFISNFHQALLYAYDYVIFSDVDEFLVPDPARYSGLKHFVNSQGHAVVAGIGLNVLHIHAEESAIDWSKAIFSQRRFVQFSRFYCKPLISKIPVQWTAGFHSCVGQYVINRHLFLFHLKAVDLKTSLEQLKRLRKVKISQADLMRDRSVQFAYSDKVMMETYFKYSHQSDLTALRAFDFSADIHTYRMQGLGSHEKSFGTISSIPERFLIPPVL